VEDLITTTGDRVISTADAILQHTRPDDPAPLDAVDALATSLDIPAASTPAASWEAVTARTPAAPITTGAPTPALSMAP
jgi:hypothetical protein